MLIGIISDVHGDYETLITTLDRMQDHHQVSTVLCAGDLVGRGPEQNRVVEAIRQRKIITVRGNHDEWFNGITDDNTAFLKGLPLDWRGSIGGKDFYMCHGKPGNNMWGMYRDHLSDTYINMVLGALKVDVLVTGHTHVPLFVRVDAGCLVNPGSLFTFHSSRVSSHSYALLSVPDLRFELYDARAPSPEPVRVEYSG